MRDTYANGVEDPRWLQDFHPDGAMSFGSEAHGHPGILTIHGVRDILHHLKEEAAEEVRRWMEEGERQSEMPDWLRAVLPPPVQPLPVLADINPAVSWEAQTLAIPQAQVTPVTFRGDRVRLVVTNVGATNPVWIGHGTDAQGFDTSGNSPMQWVKLAIGGGVGNPRTILSGGKVYAWANGAGGGQIDYQAEYGYKYREGGFLSS